MPPRKDSPHENDDERFNVNISFRDLEKTMNIFTGDDTYPISSFLDEFEDTASIMNWSKIEKLVYAKRLLSGTAKLFLRSLGRVRDYATLKEGLIEEFGPKVNSAVIHKKLASRKMKNDETFQQYFLNMKELALHGNIEDAALIEYVIDGIRDTEVNKIILYEANDIKDFRKKLDIYSDFRRKMSTRSIDASHTTANVNKIKRCYNCGETDHQPPACTEGIKCFKCNNFGHKSNECTAVIPKKSLNIQMKHEDKVSLKNISIIGSENMTEVDTEGEVNETDVNDEYDEGKKKYAEKVLKINEDYDNLNEQGRVLMDEEIVTPSKSDLTKGNKKDESRKLHTDYKPLNEKIIINERCFTIREVIARLKKPEDKDYNKTKTNTKQRLKKNVKNDELKQITEAETRNVNVKTRCELRNKVKESIQEIQEENVRNYKKRRKKGTWSRLDRVHLRQMNEQDGRVGI